MVNLTSVCVSLYIFKMIGRYMFFPCMSRLIHCCLLSHQLILCNLCFNILSFNSLINTGDNCSIIILFTNNYYTINDLEGNKVYTTFLYLPFDVYTLNNCNTMYDTEGDTTLDCVFQYICIVLLIVSYYLWWCGGKKVIAAPPYCILSRLKCTSINTRIVRLPQYYNYVEGRKVW